MSLYIYDQQQSLPILFDLFCRGLSHPSQSSSWLPPPVLPLLFKVKTWPMRRYSPWNAGPTEVIALTNRAFLFEWGCGVYCVAVVGGRGGDGVLVL